MINKLSILVLLLILAVFSIAAYSKPTPVSAELLDGKVAKYRKLGYRIWNHNDAMVERNWEFSCEAE